MHPSALFLPAFTLLTLTTAFPLIGSPLEKRSNCASALDTPQCCQLGVDGVLELTCESRLFPFPFFFPSTSPYFVLVFHSPDLRTPRFNIRARSSYVE